MRTFELVESVPAEKSIGGTSGALDRGGGGGGGGGEVRGGSGRGGNGIGGSLDGVV